MGMIAGDTKIVTSENALNGTIDDLRKFLSYSNAMFHCPILSFYPGLNSSWHDNMFTKLFKHHQSRLHQKQHQSSAATVKGRLPTFGFSGLGSILRQHNLHRIRTKYLNVET